MAMLPLSDRIDYTSFSLQGLAESAADFAGDEDVPAWVLPDGDLVIQTQDLPNDVLPVGLSITKRPKYQLVDLNKRVDSAFRTKATVIVRSLALNAHSDSLREYANSAPSLVGKAVRQQTFAASCRSLNLRLIESVGKHELGTNMLGRASNPEKYEAVRIALELPADTALKDIKKAAIATLEQGSDKAQAVADALGISYITPQKIRDYFAAQSLDQAPAQRPSVVVLKKASISVGNGHASALALAAAQRRESFFKLAADEVDEFDLPPAHLSPPLPLYARLTESVKQEKAGSVQDLQEELGRLVASANQKYEATKTAPSGNGDRVKAQQEFRSLQGILKFANEQLAASKGKAGVQDLLGYVGELQTWIADQDFQAWLKG